MTMLISLLAFGFGWSLFMSAALAKPFALLLPFGIIVGLLFGLVMAPLAGTFGALRKVTLQSSEPLSTMGQIAMIMAELGYFGTFQADGASTYKPSFQSGLLAGRITVRRENHIIELVGPRYYLWRLTSRLGARRLSQHGRTI
jgi:hypothetical protein